MRCAGKIISQQSGGSGDYHRQVLMNPTSPQWISSHGPVGASKRGQCEPNNAERDGFNPLCAQRRWVTESSSTASGTDRTEPHPDTPDAGSGETATG